VNYGFTLQPGETIVKVIHRSLISLVPSTFIAALLTTISVGLAYFEHVDPNRISLGRKSVAIIVLILLLIATLMVLTAIYVYSHNVLVFTNQHLIQVEQVGLFSRTVSQVSFNREQDISSNQAGIFPSIFDYGNVTVQSAGENVYFVFRYAPDPEAVSNEAIATNEATMGNSGQGLG